MTKNKLGIYVHIPFCQKKCNYCDFCSYTSIDEPTKEKYVDAVVRHIREYGEKCRNFEVDTVYFGGGTPTLLKLSQFEKIFSALYETFAISDDVEVTVECNPKTADYDFFCELKKLGVNRVSVGVQSSDDGELKLLGRIHDFEDSEKCVDDVKKAGIDNISVDIMFGIPNQTRESFRRTLDDVLKLSPTHISAYSLIIEDGTVFSKKYPDFVFPDEDSEYTMYEEAVSYLADRGYDRYEISNFSKIGYKSRHNLKYWRREEYLGFGVASHSFFEETRFFSPKNIHSYIGGKTVEYSEKISKNDAACEYVMLAMRTSEGVSRKEFHERFGESFDDLFGKSLERFCNEGFVVRDGDRCAFTDKGFSVSNTVLSEILTFDGK